MQRTWCGLEQVDWYDPGSHESVLAVQSPRLPPFTRPWLAGREMAGGSGAPLPSPQNGEAPLFHLARGRLRWALGSSSTRHAACGRQENGLMWAADMEKREKDRSWCKRSLFAGLAQPVGLGRGVVELHEGKTQRERLGLLLRRRAAQARSTAVQLSQLAKTGRRRVRWLCCLACV